MTVYLKHSDRTEIAVRASFWFWVLALTGIDSRAIYVGGVSELSEPKQIADAIDNLLDSNPDQFNDLYTYAPEKTERQKMRELAAFCREGAFMVSN